MSGEHLKPAIEALIFSASTPISLKAIKSALVAQRTASQEGESVENTDEGLDAELQMALTQLRSDYASRSVNLVEVASGYRFQVGPDHANWVFGLQQEKPQRYSRALLETLALVAYRQPITRGEIEDIRGVAVSSHITKTLLERKWIRVVGHRDLPGRPAMFATTRDFLDYFNLASLEDLPSLAEIKALEHPEDAAESKITDSPVGEVLDAQPAVNDLESVVEVREVLGDEQVAESHESLTFADLSAKFEPSNDSNGIEHALDSGDIPDVEDQSNVPSEATDS